MSILKKILPISVTIVMILLAGWANGGTKKETTVSDSVQIIKVEGTIDKYFTKMSDLMVSSTNVIECIVLDTNTIIYGDIPFTISNVSILNNIKGDIKTDTIKIIETGGRYKLAGNNPKEEKGLEVDYQFEGIPVVQKGEHLYLFLEPFIGPQVKDAYIPLGVFQGKFKVLQNNKVEQQVPSIFKLKDYRESEKAEFDKMTKNK